MTKRVFQSRPITCIGPWGVLITERTSISSVGLGGTQVPLTAGLAYRSCIVGQREASWLSMQLTAVTIRGRSSSRAHFIEPTSWEPTLRRRSSLLLTPFGSAIRALPKFAVRMAANYALERTVRRQWLARRALERQH